MPSSDFASFVMTRSKGLISGSAARPPRPPPAGGSCGGSCAKATQGASARESATRVVRTFFIYNLQKPREQKRQGKRYITKNGTSGVTAARSGDNSEVHYLARMALTTLVLTTAMSVAATGRLTVALFLSGLACWWFLPVLQLLTGLLMIRGSGLERRAALDGYFATHRPWSLWVLIVAAVV